MLLRRFPQLIIWHCSNHRLELAVGDTVDEVAGSNNFRSFFDKLYSVYHASPKNQRELKECCSALDIQCLTIGRVLNVRWVASSLRTVKAVWMQNGALHRHFDAASTDSTREPKEKNMYRGLKTRLSTTEFVMNLGVMYDALTELAQVSLELQRKDMTLPAAHNLLSRQVRVFSAMSDGHYGPYTRDTMSAVETRTFHGADLHKGQKCDV